MTDLEKNKLKDAYAKIEALQTDVAQLQKWLGTILDHVDYDVRPACSATEMVGAVLPANSLRGARHYLTYSLNQSRRVE